MRVPVELLIADKQNHRKLVSVTLDTKSRTDLYKAAQAYVYSTWRGWTLQGVQEGRLFQD